MFRLWFPRSWAAAAVFLVFVVVMAVPAAFAFLMVWVFSEGCFLGSCTGSQPGPAAVAGGFGALFMLVPFVGVRFFQGGRPASTALRVVVLIPMLLVASYPVRLLTGLTVLSW